jgi:hypothetical protein
MQVSPLNFPGVGESPFVWTLLSHNVIFQGIIYYTLSRGCMKNIVRFLINTCVYWLLFLFSFAIIALLSYGYVSLSGLTHYLLVDYWHDKFALIFLSSLCLALVILFIATNLFLFCFDKTFSSFIRSRHGFKSFMIERDNLVKKIGFTFYGIPLVRMGSMLNPIFRANKYMVATIAYGRYQNFLLNSSGDTELAREKYMNKKGAGSGEPIINQLVFHDDFSKYVSWPCILMVKIYRGMACVFLISLVLWLIVRPF